MTRNNRQNSGRKLTREYFDNFDGLKKLGDTFSVTFPNDLPIKRYQIRLLNSVRSYRKSKEIDFAVMTRTEGTKITLQRVK